ncbi:MAG: fibronectin type III domain-containing protein [Bacteroidales bacterium]|jgi:hypothetical protein|nr:fibronectin type III domain-containing protein [Bacteroidales bacterium]
MKKYVKLSLMALVVVGLCSCNKDEKVSAPTLLSVTNITPTGATLTWSGDADEYEVSVGTLAKTSKSTSLEVTDLQPNTEYTWKVRAKKGSNLSEWAEGPKFTTSGANATVKVNFNGQTWTAEKVDCSIQGGLLTIVAYSSLDTTAWHPFLRFRCNQQVGTESNLYKLASIPSLGEGYCQYADQFIFNLQIPGYGEFLCCDWVTLDGSFTVSEIEGTYLSGTGAFTMLEIVPYLQSMQTDPSNPVVNTKMMSIELNNVAITNASAIPALKYMQMGNVKSMKSEFFK